MKFEYVSRRKTDSTHNRNIWFLQMTTCCNLGCMIKIDFVSPVFIATNPFLKSFIESTDYIFLVRWNINQCYSNNQCWNEYWQQCPRKVLQWMENPFYNVIFDFVIFVDESHSTLVIAIKVIDGYHPSVQHGLNKSVWDLTHSNLMSKA